MEPEKAVSTFLARLLKWAFLKWAGQRCFMGQYCLCRRYSQYWLSSSLYCMHIVQCVHITQHLDKKCSFNINFGNTLALMKIMPLTQAMYMFLLLLKTLLNVIEEQ